MNALPAAELIILIQFVSALFEQHCLLCYGLWFATIPAKLEIAIDRYHAVCALPLFLRLRFHVTANDGLAKQISQSLAAQANGKCIYR